MENDRIGERTKESGRPLERAEEFGREEWKSIGGSRMRYHLLYSNRLSQHQERVEAILFVPCSPLDDKTDDKTRFNPAEPYSSCALPPFA
ncbi:MAG TPA: hypothetical protein VFV38_14390, partial [Ktedonobacteraceae bacterium]|nr:hypothetical protein [Ktedonobacteraceae bacterium]